MVASSCCRVAGFMRRSRMAHLAALAVGMFSSAAQAQFTYVTHGDGRPLIVLVHGLGGDPAGSFKGSDKSWPDLMRDDTDRVRGSRPLRDYATATLGFPAKCTDRLSLPQIASGLVRTLYDDNVWSRHPSVIFIGHSLGGLVVQEMLTSSRGDPRYGTLVDRTAGVVFLATPTGGSDHADALAALLEQVPGLDRSCPLVRDLRSIDSNAMLQKLDAEWRKFIQAEERLKGVLRRLRIACLYETKSMFGALVVSQNASTAICDERFAMNEDHVSIAKPTSRNSDLYKRVRGLIADIDLLQPQKPAETLPRRERPSGLGRPPSLDRPDPIVMWPSADERRDLMTGR